LTVQLAVAIHKGFLSLTGCNLHLDNKRYGHPQYSDGQIDGLMRYFGIGTYRELMQVLGSMINRKS